MSVSSWTVAPLVLALAFAVSLVLSNRHARTKRAMTRVGLRLFGGLVGEPAPDGGGRRFGRRESLRAAHVSATYREYAAVTVLYSGAGTVIGGILGVYAGWGILEGLGVGPAALEGSIPSSLSFLANLAGLPSLSVPELFVLMVVSTSTVGVLAGGAIYWLRWWYPRYVAGRRARAIEASLPSTVAFCYALSNGGMEFAEAIRIVARHDATYGAAAEEFDIAVTHMDVFGTDVTAALQTMGRRTPSQPFREFTENLVSVLQSGQGLSDFLERQYEEYRDEAEANQETVIGLLATLAEAYVTVLVAGPLFLITILVVIGFSFGDTLDPLRVFVYAIVPLGNLVFVVYLSVVTETIEPGTGGATASGSTALDATVSGSSPSGASASGSAASNASASGAIASDTNGNCERYAGRTMADGGVGVSHDLAVGTDADAGPGSDFADEARAAANRSRLRIYRRLRTIRRTLGSPLASVIERPDRLLLVTVPLALVVVLAVVPRAIESGPAAIDTIVILAGLFVTASYAVVYEIHRARRGAIESAVPDLLDRLASLNEAGLPVVSAVERVRSSDNGALDDELDRIWSDVRLGDALPTALVRFDARIRTRVVSRLVTLLTEAMNASGDIARVLRIASRQAAGDLRLARDRKRVMTEYMLVVYVSFLVFVFIIAILTLYLLPNLPAETATDVPGVDESIDGFESADHATFTTLFFHATVIQGATSGFVAGQLSTGDIRSGAKHAAILTSIAVVLFAVVL